MLRFLDVVFIIDDIIANEGLDKRTQPLLELYITGRHRRHYLWFLTQSYTAIPKNLRRQVEAILVSYPKERADLKTIYDDTRYTIHDVLAENELVVLRGILRN